MSKVAVEASLKSVIWFVSFLVISTQIKEDLFLSAWIMYRQPRYCLDKSLMCMQSTEKNVLCSGLQRWASGCICLLLYQVWHNIAAVSLKHILPELSVSIAALSYASLDGICIAAALLNTITQHCKLGVACRFWVFFFFGTTFDSHPARLRLKFCPVCSYISVAGDL